MRSKSMADVRAAGEHVSDDDDDEDVCGLVILDLSGNLIETGKPKADDKVKEKLASSLGKVGGLVGKMSSTLAKHANKLKDASGLLADYEDDDDDHVFRVLSVEGKKRVVRVKQRGGRLDRSPSWTSSSSSSSGSSRRVEALFEAGQRRLRPKRVGTGSAGCGHIVRALRGRSSSTSALVNNRRGRQQEQEEEAIALGAGEATRTSPGSVRGPKVELPTSLRFVGLVGCGLEARHLRLLEKTLTSVLNTAASSAHVFDPAEPPPLIVVDTRLNVREVGAEDDEEDEGEDGDKVFATGSVKQKRSPSWVDMADSDSEEAYGDESEEALYDDEESDGDVELDEESNDSGTESEGEDLEW